MKKFVPFIIGIFIFIYTYILQFFLIRIDGNRTVYLLDFLTLSLAISIPITIALIKSVELLSKEKLKDLIKKMLKIITLVSLIFSVLIEVYIVQIDKIFHISGHPPASAIWLFFFWIYIIINDVIGCLIGTLIFYLKRKELRLILTTLLVIILALPFLFKIMRY